MADASPKFVAVQRELLANAFTLADEIHDGAIDSEEAGRMVAQGRVFLPFRYGQRLAFAPAKFIGYRDNSVASYRATAKERHGSTARKVVSRILGGDAVKDAGMEARLENYCLQIGTTLAKKRHSFWLPAGGLDLRDRSAINDIDAPDVGNDDPDYRLRMAGNYVRDQKVRTVVLARAGGRCEFCQSEGFETRSGGRFLETHHVISLSEQGPDKPGNVIALCPNDHRRAHFGIDWKELQSRFLEIIKIATTPAT
ncbi:MAG TPA: HNH endonuclease signature motif containing protein [Sphingomonas sp.]